MSTTFKIKMIEKVKTIYPKRLNLGCGTEKMDGWIGVDSYPSSGADEIVNLDVLPWPYEDNSIDGIRMSHALEHLETDPIVVLSECHRILRPGGTLLIKVPSIRGPWAAFWDHKRFFSKFWFENYSENHLTPWLPDRPIWTNVKIKRSIMEDGFDAKNPVAKIIIATLNWWINNISCWERTGLFPEDAIIFKANKISNNLCLNAE